MTLKEFFESKEKLAIHCNTKEKAKKLLKAFDKLGKVWRSGTSYLDETCFKWYEESTCYTNNGVYGPKNYYSTNITIYEFEDVDLEN